MTKKIPQLIVSGLLIAGCLCAGLQARSRSTAGAGKIPAAPYPPVKFIVFSDFHYYDPSLGTAGPAFERYLNEDRKMLAESSEIMESAVDAMQGTAADFVLVCGDLTKDGELLDHQKVAGFLRRIEATGKKVYVVPGNHDILNYEAFRYNDQGTETIAHIAAEDFPIIYDDFGYGEAIERDSASLSYVGEPVPGLWLLALDGNLYRRNKPGHESQVGGRLSTNTLDWMRGVLDRAAQKEKSVIAMIHHGILEHFLTEAKYFPPYLLSNRNAVSRLFLDYNVKIVFTGHFHAQDIVLEKFGGQNLLYDVETGSLVTYPAAYRTIEIDADQKMHIGTEYITATASRPLAFAEYAREFTRQGLEKLALSRMITFGVKTYNAPLLARQVADVLLNHYRGDEPRNERPIDISQIGCLGGVLTSVLDDAFEGLAHDREPPDNNLIIDLKSGSWALPGKEP